MAKQNLSVQSTKSEDLQKALLFYRNTLRKITPTPQLKDGTPYPHTSVMIIDRVSEDIKQKRHASKEMYERQTGP